MAAASAVWRGAVFPPEFAKLYKMVANRDRRVWAIAAGQAVPDTIDDGNTGDLPAIESNTRGK